MATFDPAAFAKGLIVPAKDAARPLVGSALEDARAVLAAIDELESDTAETLRAIQSSTGRLAELLKTDMAVFLPARRAAIMARAATLLGGDGQAALETALVFLEKAAIVAAKAFLLG